MTFLFIATIGPVQPFIASARRTRDLYAGSTLLSELSKAAAQKIAQQEGIQNLIFPAPPLEDQEKEEDHLAPDTALNVANKIVALVQHHPKQLGEDVQKAIQARLNDVKVQAFHRLPSLDHTMANAQIEHLVEYSWVAVPFDDNATDKAYEQARESAEAVLGARKNTHFFAPVTWGNRQEKSSIDGKLECVIPPTMYARRGDTVEKRREKASTLYNQYRAGLHERLSAVDLLKRRAWLDDSQQPQPASMPVVLSTSHIAATPFLQRLREMNENNQEKARFLWDNYIKQVAKLIPSDTIETLPSRKVAKHPVIGYLDGAMLFEGRLLEEAINDAALTPVREAAKEFFTFTSTILNGMYPSPYYAILQADGDGMGKAIEAQAKKGPARHRELSQALADFAKKVSEIVPKHQGSLVYAGGDDVLALLPLHTILDCAKELADNFRAGLNSFESDDGTPPTLSAGIAIVHHLSLLQDSLTLVRAAEHRAKGYPGKNALAMTIRKRSGEDSPLTFSFKQLAPFERLIDLYKQGILPHGAAYELREMLQRLQPSKEVSQEEAILCRQAIQIDAARILRRKLCLPRSSQATQDKGSTAEVILTEVLQRINVEKDSTGGFHVIAPKETHTIDIAPFINELIVAQFLATEDVEGSNGRG